jgi:hypothetical protein
MRYSRHDHRKTTAKDTRACSQPDETEYEEKRLLTVSEFCRRYSIGRSFAYEEMAAGRLLYRKLGNRRRIFVEDAESWSSSKAVLASSTSEFVQEDVR